MEVPITFMDEEDISLFISDAQKADVVIDAMFGFGLNGEVRGVARIIN